MTASDTAIDENLVKMIIPFQCMNEYNSYLSSAAYMRQWTGSALVQVMACRLVDAKTSSKPLLAYCQLDP